MKTDKSGPHVGELGQSAMLTHVRAEFLRQLESAEMAGAEVELVFSGELDAGDPPGHHFARGVPTVDGWLVQLTNEGRESWWYPVLRRLDGDPPAIVGVRLVGEPGRLTLLSDVALADLIGLEAAKLATPNERAREAIARLGINTSDFPSVAELAKRDADLDGQLADHQLEQALKLAEVAMQFGQVLRTTEHPDGQPESDTTHTVMLGLLAIELAPSELRRAQLLGAVLVHDLVETYAKDTCTAWGLTDGEREHKAAREQAALEQLRALGLPRIVELIEDYERQSTPEARWVRYIDKICPRLTHLLNRGSALRSIGMTREDMISKHAEQAAELVEMYPEQAHARELYAAATERCEAELLGDQAPTRTGGHSFTIDQLHSQPRTEMNPPQFAIDRAVRLANTSPCCKSKRGVVIYKPAIYRPDNTPQLISGGHNSPPRPLGCDGSPACMANCAKLCEHAEMEALRDMTAHYLDQLELLHVKTADGQLAVSGGPSCWQCSRSIARERRVAGVWLFHDTGWRRYTTEEFHRLTLKECGLPIIEEQDA